MSIATLPGALKAKANVFVENELAQNRGHEWAVNYHRKLVLMIQEDKERGNFYSEHNGELCINMSMMLNLEVENALRALIDANKNFPEGDI